MIICLVTANVERPRQELFTNKSRTPQPQSSLSRAQSQFESQFSVTILSSQFAAWMLLRFKDCNGNSFNCVCVHCMCCMCRMTCCQQTNKKPKNTTRNSQIPCTFSDKNKIKKREKNWLRKQKASDARRSTNKTHT